MENYQPIEHFEKFTDNPKGCSVENIKGSLNYLLDVQKNTKSSPTNSTFIHIFNFFHVKNSPPIKDYVYKRLTKTILLELAIALLQEIASCDIERAKTLVIVLKRTSSGGKEVKLSDAPSEDEFPLSPSAESILCEIDEAEFSLDDSTKKSPSKIVRSGKRRALQFSQTKDASASSPEELPPPLDSQVRKKIYMQLGRTTFMHLNLNSQN